MQNSYSKRKPHPYSIYTRFTCNTRYVIPLFSYTATLFEWSQMKIIKLEFPIFWYETFFMFKTSLLLLNFCLCVNTCTVTLASEISQLVNGRVSVCCKDRWSSAALSQDRRHIKIGLKGQNVFLMNYASANYLINLQCWICFVVCIRKVNK